MVVTDVTCGDGLCDGIVTVGGEGVTAVSDTEGVV